MASIGLSAAPTVEFAASIGGVVRQPVIADPEHEPHAQWGEDYSGPRHVMVFHSLLGSLPLRTWGIKNRSVSDAPGQRAGPLFVDQETFAWLDVSRYADELKLVLKRSFLQEMSM